MFVNDVAETETGKALAAGDGLLFVGVCRLCVSSGVVLLGERGNLYFCNKVITNALPQGGVTTVRRVCHHLTGARSVRSTQHDITNFVCFSPTATVTYRGTEDPLPVRVCWC